MKLELATLSDLELIKVEIIKEIKRSQKEEKGSKKWMRSAEVKKMLGLSGSQLQTLRNNRSIPYTKLGKTYYYNYDDINRKLIENMSTKGGL